MDKHSANLQQQNYSKKLQEILAASGWTQEKLADELEVSFPTLNSWANGKSEPREAAKQRIDALADEILGSDELDGAQLTAFKVRAMRYKYSLKKLINDRATLDRLTLSLTYHTDAIEGSPLSENEVQGLLFAQANLANRTYIEQQEARNHQEAFYYLLSQMNSEGDSFAFTPSLVQAVHSHLMTGIMEDAGLWRTRDVRLKGVRVALASYRKVPALIENWCNLANGETMDKIGLLAETHAKFEQIHPFADGSGRVGRLLLFALALKLGIVPPILPKDRRVAYYKYLELAQSREDYDPLEQYIAESVIDIARMIEG